MSEDAPLQPANLDILLETFHRMVAEPGAEVGLTLWVPGGVVSGNLVGRTEWLAKMLETHPATEGVVGGFAGGLVDFPAADDPCLHLVDARMMIGAQWAPTDAIGLFWRGRLDQVSAWAMGRVGPQVGWA